MTNQEAYKQKFESKLKEADAQIDQLVAKAQSAEAEAKIKFDEQISMLKSKRNDIEKRFSDFKSKSSDAMDDVSSGLDRAWDELTSSIKSAKQHLQ